MCMRLVGVVISREFLFPQTFHSGEGVGQLVKLESILQYMEGYLDITGYVDDPRAVNGLQVGGPEDVEHIVGAVDASEASIMEAVARGADLMIVHHGLFWAGIQPLTGRHLRRVKPLIDNNVALFSCHLPLDSHSEVGNAAVLGRKLGVHLDGRFGQVGGREIGWHGHLTEFLEIEGFRARVAEVLGGSPHVITGGPALIERVGVVTGAGTSTLEEAVELGLDVFVTGEGPHHTHFDAMELGIHVLFGGHYATETFGVKALAAHLGERFSLRSEFIDQPTGL